MLPKNRKDTSAQQQAIYVCPKAKIPAWATEAHSPLTIPPNHFFSCFCKPVGNSKVHLNLPRGEGNSMLSGKHWYSSVLLDDLKSYNVANKMPTNV